MPDSTPIYGFTFPCPDEVVGGAAFATLANQIDAKLNEVNADLIFALNRPNVDIIDGTPSTQTIPANVDTVLTLPTSTYTFQTAGVWIVRAYMHTSSAPTMQMMRGRIRQNAVVRYSYISNTEGDIPHPVVPVGPIIAAVGDVITLTFQYTGAGTMDVFARLSAKLLVRIP